ncbi:hypothetical protein Dred_1184 [Desulforamulus reducens MI-1]|uniref:HTH cro/C1-type domain-containing protein n=1 Tax=Desulforamulus reducens (strain ATCC BAA-1160 / DSM 100696 / MI-1) TaxID=349161 RepID=A4J3R5_DESRM|nr:helix-turn-helix transcriptional regulator [Desulforamulus reducens]ABO49718.1 hypothetical protein Dred_1184 [Desulforamulus reducens MI-1]
MAKKKRKYPELTALKGKIREMGTTYRKIAEEMGIGVNTLSDKINGFYAISGPEMEQIATILDINPKDVAYFFMPSYCKTQQRSA